MKRIKYLLLAFTLSIAPLDQTLAGIETIDCQADDMNRAERTICESQHLQVLDAKMTQAYADRMLAPRVPAARKQELRDSQLRFLRERNACGSDVVCLENAMLRRIRRIELG